MTGCLGRTALAVTVALALVQVPALAQTNNAEAKAAPPAATDAVPAPAAAGTPDSALGAPIDPFAKGTAQNGATKSAVCSSCHGTNGNSANPDWPRLAGQS